MHDPDFPQARRWAGLFTVLYLCLVSCMGRAVHDEFAFFPELAALAYGMFMRPTGPWAKAPLMVVVTPAGTALWGVLVANLLPYGPLAAVLCIGGGVLVVKALKSPVLPAVPAGFLPLVFGVKDLHYVGFIILGTGGLALLSMAYQQWGRGMDLPAAQQNGKPARVNVAMHLRVVRWAAFSIALALAYLLADRLGNRLILFPPLIVIAYETLVGIETCPWARQPLLLPTACMGAAILGWAGIVLFGAGPLSVLLSLGTSIVFIRALRVFMPPALAISVIPQIMPHADATYPAAIGAGIVAVMLVRRILDSVAGHGHQSAGHGAIE